MLIFLPVLLKEMYFHNLNSIHTVTLSVQVCRLVVWGPRLSSVHQMLLQQPRLIWWMWCHLWLCCQQILKKRSSPRVNYKWQQTWWIFYNVIITPRKCFYKHRHYKQSCQRVHLSPRAKELTIIIGTSLMPLAVNVYSKILFNYLLSHEDTIFSSYKDGFQTSKKCAQQNIYSFTPDQKNAEHNSKQSQPKLFSNFPELPLKTELWACKYAALKWNNILG